MIRISELRKNALFSNVKVSEIRRILPKLQQMYYPRSAIICREGERGDWLYIKDAISAIWALWGAKRISQRIYNISGGVHAIRDVVEIARKIKPEAPVTLTEGGQSLSPYPVAYDDTPARRDLGWAPAYTIESAVREHIQIVSDRRQ